MRNAVFPPAPGWGPQTRGASASMPIPIPICGSAPGRGRFNPPSWAPPGSFFDAAYPLGELTNFAGVSYLVTSVGDGLRVNRELHYSFVAENRRTKSGFSFANGDSVTHMRQGFPLQRFFAAPLPSICPAALIASSRTTQGQGVPLLRGRCGCDHHRYGNSIGA